MEIINLADRRARNQVIVPDTFVETVLTKAREQKEQRTTTGNAIKKRLALTPWEEAVPGVNPKHAKDVAKALAASNANFNVYLDPLMTKDGVTVPNKAVRRADNNVLLGVVGRNYTPLQNEKAFEFFQPILDGSDAELVSAGSIYGGRKASIIVRLPGDEMMAEVAKGDVIESYLKLTNCHDGSGALKVDFLPLRLVCLNGLACFTEGTNLLKTRHTRDIGARLDNVQDIIRRITDDFREVATLFKSLQAKSVKTEEEFRAYAAKALEVKPDSQQVDQCVINLHSSPGAKEAGMTYWGAYNAVNYYLQYQAKEDKAKGIESLLFGPNDLKNRRALALAIAA